MHIFFCELFVCAFLFVNVCAYHQDENNKRENFINVKEPESRPKVFQKDQKFSKESLFKNCIFKETSDSLEKLLGKLLKKSNEEIFNFINKKENVKENGSKVLQSPFFAKLASRKTRQAFPAQESSMDWSKCALRSELQEHALVENIHIASISQEIKKLQQLVRLLQDQQYILNILKDFDNKPKSEDIGDQKQLIRLLQLLKNNIPQKNELETNFIPQGKSENFISVEKPKPRHEKPLIESHENITNLVHELNQLKHLIVNKSLQEVQNKNEGEKLQHELDNQKHLLEELKNRIEHLKSNKTTEEAPKLRQSEGENQVEMIQQQLEELEGKLSEFMAKHPSSEQNIVGASLPNQNHTPTLLEKLRNPKPFSRKSEDEDDLETLFSNLNNQDKPKPKILQKHLHNLSPSKNKLKPRANEEDFVENLQRLLSDPDQTLEPKQNSFAFKEAAPALEDRLGNLQKRMEVLKKIQKLEKKVKELHEDEAESKSNSDDDDSVKKQLKTMMREIKKLNKEQIEGKDADDLQNEFKNLQAEINNLKPNDEEDSSFGKIGKVSDVQFMLNKIFQQGEVIQPVPVPHVPHSLHLSPAQIQLLKTKLIQMRHGPQHPEPFLPQPGPVPVPSLYTHGGYYGQHGNPTALYGIGQYEAGLYGAAPYDKYGSPGGGNYGSASGDAAYGSYGSTSGKYGNQYTNMLHGLLETQYGSGGKYGSGSSGLYGTGDALYGAGPYASSGGASYGASNALYGNDGGGYEAGSSYGPGGKPYGSGGGLYGPIATAPYGANPYASTSAGGAPYESPRGGYGSVAAPYSKAYSPSPYGSASGSYGSSSGSYGSTSGPYGIVSGSHSGSYGSISGPYGSSSGTYGSGTGPYGSSNRAYGSAHGSYGSASGSYGVTGGPYGSATGPYGATGRPYGSSGAYGASNEQYGHNGAAYGSNTGQYGSSSPYGADAEPYGGNGRPYGSGSGSYKSGSESYGSENVAYGSSGNPYASAVAPYKNPTLYEDSSYNSGGKPYGSSHGGGGGIYSSEGGSAVKSYNSGPAGNTYGTSSGQYQPNANKYGPNDQQYGSGNQQYATSAVNDGGKLYGSKPGIQYAAGSNSYKPPMYSSSSPPAPHNSYNQPNQPIYPNKPAYTNHDVNVHAVFENMAHSYQDDPKPQFFPSYKGSKGYGPNDAANYPPTTNSNGPNSQQPYANPSHNPTVGDSYAQQKVNELKTQIYGLENVINNLSGPEYTQKPGDQEMKRELDHKIDYLKHMVRDLSKDAPGSSYAPGSRSDQAYNPYGDPEPNDEEEYSNRRKREAPTNKPPSAMEDFFDYLNNIMSVVQYYTEGWPKGNQTEEEQKIRSTRQSNQDGEVPKETLLHIFDQFNNLVNIVNDLSANISKNNFSCVQNKTCVNDQIKSTIKQLSDQPIVSAIRKRRQVQAEEDDDSGDVWKTVSSVFKGMVSDINNQESGDSETVALHSPDPLQQKLEDLKKQFKSEPSITIL